MILIQVPEAPTELGLETEHLQSVFGLCMESRSLLKESGRRGVVDEVIDKEVRAGGRTRRKTERGLVYVGVHADWCGVDYQCEM